jgi:valyl-tRNA synthetase
MILAFAYETSTGAKVASDLVEEREGKYFHTETGEELKQIVAKMSKSLKNVVNPDDVIDQIRCRFTPFIRNVYGSARRTQALGRERGERGI